MAQITTNTAKKPMHITNLLAEEYEENNFSYIMSRERLQTKINEMCNKLQHPITIINLNYEDIDNVEIQARVDSTASTYAIRKSCWNLRTYIGEFNCIHCDYYHALACAKLMTDSNVSSNLPDYFSDEYTQPVKKKCNGINYIEYNCPMLGFVELCFPIHFKERIIGVLFLGELLLENYEEKINKFQTNFLSKNNHLFDSYTQKYKNLFKETPKYIDMLGVELAEKDKFAENILERDFSIPKINSMEIQTSETLERLIKTATKQIRKFEDELVEIWEEKHRKLFPSIVEDLRVDFDDLYKRICDKDEIIYTDVQNLFYETCNYIVKLKNEFDFTYCRIFENLPIVQTNIILQETSDSGDCPYEHLECNFQKCSLRISKCKNSDSEKSDNNPIRCFSDKGVPIDKNNNIVFACKNIAVIFGINQRCDNFNVLIETISDSIQHLCGDIEYVASAFTRTHHEYTLRMYKHECEHLAVRIEHNNRYYEKREFYNMLSDEKHRKIFNDIKSTAILLQRLSLNIGLIQGTVKLDSIKESLGFVDIRDEFNKWRAMFRLELVKKNIRIYNTTKKSNEGILVYAYESLLAQLLYNLIDNAVKYSYWGTNIRTEINQGKITIEDYGMGLDNSNQVYDLFYRSPNAKNNYLGDGIGLYSSKKIANLLDVDLKHECELVSEYNIPFLIEAHKRGWDLKEYDIDYDMVIASIDNELLEKMLIDPEYHTDKRYKRLSSPQLKAQLKKPIYRVKFTISNFGFAQIFND